MKNKNISMQNDKYNLLDSVRLPFRDSPINVILIAFISVLTALVPVFNTYAVSGFINHALAYINGEENITIVYLSIVSIIVILVIKLMANILLKLIQTKLAYNFKSKFQIKIIRQKAKLKYQYYEQEDTCDLIERVGKNTDERILKSFRNIINIISLCISIVGILITLTLQIWWAGIAIFGVAIPLLVLSIKSGKANYEVGKEIIVTNRKCNYLKDILIKRDYVYERTLTGYTDHVDNEYRRKYEEARMKENLVKKRWFIKLKLGGIASSLLSYSVALILIPSVILGELSIGMYLALVGTILELVSFLSWQISSYIDTLANDLSFYRDLTDFMNIHMDDEEVNSNNAIKNDFNIIVFRDVRFKYQGQQSYILDGVNLAIQKGKSYSFVGINGAGKTTIIKLLLGLYREYEGEILIDGRDLKSFSLAEIRGMFGCIFQDFCKYEISLLENIVFNIKEDSDEIEYVYNSLQNSGLSDFVEKLPRRLKTNLGKLEQDGIDLSGGEWQKVALTRAFMQKSSVLILDEPTASMDPIAESKMYSLFQKLLLQRTIIMISHRLGSTIMADQIFVLNDGRIIESGNHKELIKLNGIYTDMYIKQKRWYEDES